MWRSRLNANAFNSRFLEKSSLEGFDIVFIAMLNRNCLCANAQRLVQGVMTHYSGERSGQCLTVLRRERESRVTVDNQVCGGPNLIARNHWRTFGHSLFYDHGPSVVTRRHN